MTIDEKI